MYQMLDDFFLKTFHPLGTVAKILIMSLYFLTPAYKSSTIADDIKAHVHLSVIPNFLYVFRSNSTALYSMVRLSPH